MPPSALAAAGLGKVAATSGLAGPVRCVAFSPCSSQLAAGGSEGAVEVYGVQCLPHTPMPLLVWQKSRTPGLGLGILHRTGILNPNPIPNRNPDPRCAATGWATARP